MCQNFSFDQLFLTMKIDTHDFMSRNNDSINTMFRLFLLVYLTNKVNDLLHNLTLNIARTINFSNVIHKTSLGNIFFSKFSLTRCYYAKQLSLNLM